MKRLFGTDGIRGVAGKAPLEPTTVRQFGAALAQTIAPEHQNKPVLFGRGTRESGPWLRDAVAAGLSANGVPSVDAGVISTPGLSYLLCHGEYAAGVMISASHNPFQDNGLKVFGPDGVKLCDVSERKIESLILDDGIADPGANGTVSEQAGLTEQYVQYLQQLLPADRFKGLHFLLDCANGSACEIAPRVFEHYGATFEVIGAAPNGKNINLDCGSTHLDSLAERVANGTFSLGIGFDGDADRCLAVDPKGRTIDGDHILFLCGRSLSKRGQLKGAGVVATIMSNYWLEDRLGQVGVELHRSQVGDKYVLEQMCEKDLALGGEQSGHVIFRDHARTGDGILTALMLIDTLIEESESVQEILDGIEPYPQVLLNVRVSEKPDLRAHSTIGPLVAEIEDGLKGSGRVVLRYSGTEPVARVMVEGKDATGVEGEAQRLAALIEAELGG